MRWFLLVFLLAGCAGASPVFSQAPTTGEIEASIRRGIAFLVEDQNADGSWGSARQTKGLNIYAPVPGAHHAFRTAVTAMTVSGLLQCGISEDDGAAGEALARGQAYLIAELPRVRRATADAIYNVWTHAYGIDALALMHERSEDEEIRATLSRLIQGQIELLERFESVDGGWGYYDFRACTAKPSSRSISFTTATVLVALDAARKIEGIEVPDRLIRRAVASINRQRKSDLSYLYGEYLKHRPMYGINRPAGSLGRSQACNYALRLWGDQTITDRDLDEWMDRLARRNGWLDIGRKRPVPHESWFAVAGYFFYYGHYYAALCTGLLPEDLARPHRAMLASVMLEHQEKDGSWWDFPFYSYHQPYGTAFALMTLSRCR